MIGQMKGPGGSLGSLDPGEALLKIGRPTLVVPDGVSSLRAEHVVIGWKDAREARRALQDSLPFLHEATRVTVVEICDPGKESTAQKQINDVVHYFGAAPNQRQFPRYSPSAGIWRGRVDQVRAGGRCRHNCAWRLRTQPPWRVDLRWRDTGLAWHELDLLPDVSLIVCKRPHERQTWDY
jgi:hypothetical protein